MDISHVTHNGCATHTMHRRSDLGHPHAAARCGKRYECEYLVGYDAQMILKYRRHRNNGSVNPLPDMVFQSPSKWQYRQMLKIIYYLEGEGVFECPSSSICAWAGLLKWKIGQKRRMLCVSQ
jgi:hypothetical protein